MPVEIDGLVLYTIDELAEKLDISKESLRKYCQEGKIHGQKLGGKWFISRKTLLEYFGEEIID